LKFLLQDKFFFFFEKIFFPLFILFTFVSKFKLNKLNYPSLLFPVIKTSLVLFCVYFSSKPKKTTHSWVVFSATFCSYLVPIFFNEKSFFSVSEKHIFYATLFTSIFYYLFLFYSYFYLGKNFSILPAYKDLVKDGPYQLLRHPIYACYIHLGFIVVFINLNISNIILFTIYFSLLYFRSLKEEEIQMLSNEHYLKNFKSKKRFFSIWTSFPVILMCMFILLKNEQQHKDNFHEINVQLGFPAISLDPKIYDDWSSVFIGNHIYPRLFSEPDRNWDYSISKDFKITCEDLPVSQNIDLCKNIKIKFNLKTFEDCNQNHFDKIHIKNQINEILKLKSWILPKFKECHDGGYDVCYEGKNVKDLLRRLNNLYFRFGWSDSLQKTKLIGAGPYCLEVRNKRKNDILSGKLIPKSTESLPIINFFTSSNANSSFNFALYGHPSLVQGNLKIIPAQTPLAYYMVTNKKWSSYDVPWNKETFKNILSDYLIDKNLVYSREITSKLINFVPSGKAGEIKNLKEFKKTQKAYISLPDYFPDCFNLSLDLTKFLNVDYPNLIVTCENTSQLIDEKIRQKKGNWDTFLSPLSPGAPGRDSIKYQYFSKDSLESWTEDYSIPENIFYLVGIGQSWVVVDNDVICGLTPNPLGQGDVLITDLKWCN
jgi:protein-S-isoprenylcysteine O-methyltransferase Ste14